MKKRAVRRSLSAAGTDISDALFYCGRERTSARPTDESWFLNRTIECGPATLDMLARSLQVPRRAVRSVRWNRDYFSIKFSYTGVSHCLLKKFKSSERAQYGAVGLFRIINELVLIVPGAKESGSLKSFLDGAVRGLSAIRPHELFSVLRKDVPVRMFAPAVSTNADRIPVAEVPARSLSLSGEKVQGTAGRSERIARTEFPFYEWGNEHLSSIFMFAPMMRSRVAFSGVRTERMQEIVHGDNECVYTADKPDPGHFIGFVDMGALHEAPVFFGDKRDRVDEAHHGLPGAPVSVLYDEDVIQGATVRLKKLLCALARSGKECDFLVNCTCTPLIIGDDVRSVLRNINAAENASFLYCDAVKQNASDVYLEYARSLVAGLEQYAPVPGTIDLVGFPRVSAVSELLNVLASIGITCNTAVLPLIGPANCESYYKGQAQVFFPNADNMNIYEKVFFPLPRPYVMPAAPYGFVRTRAWGESICNVLQLGPAVLQQWQEVCAMKEKHWRPLVEEAGQYRLGMVITPEDIPFLCDPLRTIAGVPLIPFLEEMGFLLDIAIYCSPERYEDLRTKVVALLSRAEGHRIMHCFGPQAVRRWLRDPGTVCVYSDLSTDIRLACAGKTRFSIADLEMGFDGAIRSVRRLLRKCKNTFYARYQGHFDGPLMPVVFKEVC